MDTELTAFDAVEIAEKIERNGARFYRQAAGLCADHRTQALFVQLAQWESRHQSVFGQMKPRYADRREPPDNERDGHGSVLKPVAMAGLAVFGLKPDPCDELSGRESRADVLRLAIEKEKDSIVFYSGLKAFLADRKDSDALEAIIAEEMKHLRILTQSLAESG